MEASVLIQSIQNAFQNIVTDLLQCIAAVAPIGLTVFGAMLAWRYGVKFFKGLSK